MSTKHTPPGSMRKPGKREARGLSAILSEMEATAQDMRTYRNADERKRAEDIFAGLRWIDAAIATESRADALAKENAACWRVYLPIQRACEAAGLTDATGAIDVAALQEILIKAATTTAAPELLAALQRALDAGIGADGNLPSASEQARAAIAKATGGAP